MFQLWYFCDTNLYPITMKKVFYYTLSVALVAVTMTSCGKSTKGKMAGEWKVTSMSYTLTENQSNGDKSVEDTKQEGTTLTMTSTTTSGSSSTTETTTATVVVNDLTIEKDGTWTWTRETNETQNIFGGTIVQNEKTTQTGTWNFVKSNKTEEFKKNERILFNILTESSTTTTTSGSTSSTSSDNQTYLTGENTMLFTVVESKKKSLQLEAETAYSSTSGNTTYSNTGMMSITLEAK